MERDTVLIKADCEVKRLPLDATEAFVLSQVDGRLTLEEIGEIVGLDFAKTSRLAARLVELGAVAPSRLSRSRHGARSRPRAAVASLRPDPRVEPRGEPRVDADACDLDEATCARIAALDAKLAALDHYALLEIERGSEKREVKRAYFAMASKFHPDRLFGRKLGRVRAPLERIFVRLTEAHDTLSNAARRAEYDAKLRGARPAEPAPRRSSARMSKSGLSKAQGRSARKSSRSLKALTAPPSDPPKAAAAPAPVMTGPPPPPSVGAAPPASASEGRFRRLHAAAKQIEGQRHADVFVQAAEAALKADDVVGAANNFRLALEVAEDPVIRLKYEAVEELAKATRIEKSLARARAAEREKRWADAALYFSKANDARPDAAVAERAAHALRLSGGDLRRAVTLAEQAVAHDGKNAGYRVTLGEAYLAANLHLRAATESARALELAPNHPRAKELAAAVSKKK